MPKVKPTDLQLVIEAAEIVEAQIDVMIEEAQGLRRDLKFGFGLLIIVTVVMALLHFK